MTKFLNISVDDTLGGASPSDETVSSQKALKTYIDGRGLSSLSDVNIEFTPSNGQFLMYDSSKNAWENAGVQFLPTQTGNDGKFLTTNGTTPSWQEALKPNQAIVGSTKTKITYDSNGLVTAGADLSLLDIAEAGNDISIVKGGVAVQDFNKTGNPTITDYTISGLNFSNYISSTNFMPPSGIYKFVINCTFQRNTTYPAYVQPIVSNLTNNYGLFISPANHASKPNALSFYDDYGNDIYGTTNLVNGKYWFGLIFNSNTRTVQGFQMYDDGTYTRDTLPDFSNPAWTQEFNGTAAVDKFSGNKIKLGSNGNINYIYWVGSIYLPYTYVEANGSNFWSPVLLTEKYIINSTAVIPTVNNPTITITQGGTTKGSFTLNQASGDTIALDDTSLPSQTGNSGKFLMTNGTTTSWEQATTWTYDSTTETLTIT